MIIKPLQNYLNTSTASIPIDMTENNKMKPLKKYAQVDITGNEGLYETSIDRWSRNAKHQFGKSELASAIDSQVDFIVGDTAIYKGTEVKIKIPQGPKNTTGILWEGHLTMVKTSSLQKIDEGLIGGLKPMQSINRMMQLAGLEFSGSTVKEDDDREQTTVDNQSLDNSINSEDTIFKDLLQTNTDSNEYKDSPDAAKVATLGQVLSSLQELIDALPSSLPSNVATQIKTIPEIGNSLIQVASSMVKSPSESD